MIRHMTFGVAVQLVVYLGGAIVLLGVAFGLALLAWRLWKREDAKRRVPVPARYVRTGGLRNTRYIEVEYPDPWGRPMRARIFGGSERGFTRQVWVDPQNPQDAAWTQSGRRGGAVICIVVAFFLASAGLSLAANGLPVIFSEGII